MKTTFDVTGYTKSLQALIKKWTLDAITDEMAALGWQILRNAIESPVPSDSRELEASAQVEKNPGRVTLGFNKTYAAFQDSGHLPGATERVVKPNPPKKFLFIPLTESGKRHTVGANPRDEGLKYGVDYVLAKQARIPIKPYGSPLGPNKYFSKTFEDHVDWFYEQLGAILGADVEEIGKKSRQNQRRRR